jgi:alpha-galactosidase
MPAGRPVDQAGARCRSRSTPTSRTFHLRNEKVSYLIRVLENGTLGHLHFGGSLAESGSYGRLSGREFLGFANRLGERRSRSSARRRASATIGVPALVVEQPERVDGAGPALRQPPCLRREAGNPRPALHLRPELRRSRDARDLLADTPASLEIRLFFTIYADRPVMTRSARVRNVGTEPLTVECAMSASLDLPDSDWDLVHLSGAWARECQVRRAAWRPARSRSAA